MYEYKMIQIPPNIAVQMKAHKGNEAAAYLENVTSKVNSLRHNIMAFVRRRKMRDAL